LQEGQIEQVCSDVSGIDLTEFFSRYLYGTEDIPFEALFADFGIEFTLHPASSLTDLGGEKSQESLPSHLGATLLDTPQKTVKITHVWQQQPAYQAGLAAGDELVAINHIKVSNKQQIETLLKRSTNNTVWHGHYFRRDELRTCQITLTPPPSDRVYLAEKGIFNLNKSPSTPPLKWL